MIFVIAKRKKDIEENKPLPDYFLIGGAVDIILTGVEGEYEQNYHVSTLDKMPSDVEKQITDFVFNSLVATEALDEASFSECPDLILQACDTLNWQANWKAETRVNKIIEKCEVYFEELAISVGKEVISAEMHNRIMTIVNSLRTNERTKKYFDRELQAELENMDFYYQLPIYFTYAETECKALLDIVIVTKDEYGHILKIEPIDLKTMSGNTLDFHSSMKSRRYDMQAAWYVEALTHYFQVTPPIIEPFKFIVESTTNMGLSVVYEITDDTLDVGKHGLPSFDALDVETGRVLYYKPKPGWVKLVALYLYYQRQGFRQDIIFDSNPGVIKLDWTKGIL